MLVLALPVACTGDQSEDSTSTTSVLETTTTTMEDLSEELATALANLEDLQSRFDALEGQLDTVQGERDDLAQQLAAAQQEISGLLLAYDPQIQAAIAAGMQTVIDDTCASITGDESPIVVSNLIDAAVRAWENQPGLPEGAGDSLNREAIDAAVQGCLDDAVAALIQAELTADKGDGFYTVGTEIAPGVWESQGSGDSCYWARFDAAGDINDNHFGLAGGRVTIQSSDAEVQFDDCGMWVYQG